MYPVNFEPFVGKDYHTQSPKLLILGESHYGLESDTLGKNFTNFVVRKYAKRETGETRRFFTLIAKTVDRKLDNQTALELWDKVAFYNYVQVLVGDGPRTRPTDQMFNQSNDAFRQVIDQLKPDILIVLGRRLGWHLDYFEEDFAPFLSNVIQCRWYHPSTPRYFKAHQAVEALETARQQFYQRSSV
ncbi:hypothetical protein ACAW74_16375 [Fibrella sp. WM1]|uniref:hypothetical protein n=1 Tax=Fibrella musci TaxID=3242485 RepID=UPI003523025D